MKRTPLFRAALSALWLPFACSPDVVAQDTTASSGSASGTDTGPTPEPDSSPEPDPSPPGAGAPGAPCQVDADCSAANFCALRICVLGCSSAADCDGGQICDLHGRCATHEEDPPPRVLASIPVLAERLTILAPGETRARTVLRNDGATPLVYRLAVNSPALQLDTAIAEVGPADEVELVAEVDRTALGPADRVLPIQIITSGGAIVWSLGLEALPESGRFRGAVNFTAGSFGLASSDLAAALDFRGDGTIAGRVDNDVSLLWPQPLEIAGTWAPTGDFTIELRDRLPAEGWRHSPIARELGRVLILTGTRTTAGLEGAPRSRRFAPRAALSKHARAQ